MGRTLSALLSSLLLMVAGLTPARAAQPLSPTLGDIEGAMDPPPRAKIFVAKRIITMDPRRPRGDAVAVLDGRVLAVGTLDDLIHAAGEQPLPVDETFRDKVLTPGFIDPQVHPGLAALAFNAEIISIEDWNLPDGLRPGVRDREGYLARLRDAESRLTDAKTTLVTWGYLEGYHGLLARADLDAISNKRPIIVWHRSGGELILNSPAMERYGITAERLGRQSATVQSQSNPDTGVFREQGAVAILRRLAPVIAPPQSLRKGLDIVESYLQAGGLTTIAASEGVAPGTLRQAQSAILGDDATPLRTYYLPDGKGIAERFRADPKRMLGATEAVGVNNGGKTCPLHRQVRLYLDGSAYSRLMKVNGGYADGGQGAWVMEPELFASAFQTYWDAGYQLHVQVNGDAALKRLLDNLERQMRRHPRYDHRTTVLHFAMAGEQQIQRLAMLRAVVCGNPHLVTALADLYAENGLGPDRADNLVPLGAAKRAGLPVSLCSDLPMAPAQPLHLIWSAVNRNTLSGRVAGSDQRLGVEDALAAVTINAAYLLHLEDEIGSIEPGKLANFAVLESDPFEVPPEQIRSIGIWGTVLEGRVQPVARPILPARTAGLLPGVPGPLRLGLGMLRPGAAFARGLLPAGPD